MDYTTNHVLTKVLVFLSINPALNDDGQSKPSLRTIQSLSDKEPIWIL